MSWQDLIVHLQLTAHRVDKVIVYDRHGRPLAVTDNTETNQSEGQSLIKCFLDRSKTVSKLSIDNEIFIFVQGIDRTLVGKSIRDKERIAVACIDQGDDVVLLIGQPLPNCSFIAELLKSFVLRSRGQLMSLQQQLLEQDANNSSLPIIGDEQVLVDLGQGTET